KAQASSKSSLRTSVAGRVVAVLASGTLVVEANRELVTNNEKQTILVRGLIRPGDIAPDNTVLSQRYWQSRTRTQGKGRAERRHPSAKCDRAPAAACGRFLRGDPMYLLFLTLAIMLLFSVHCFSADADIRNVLTRSLTTDQRR